MSTVRTGRYTITNVKQGNVAVLPDPNDGTPLSAGFEDSTDKTKVNFSLSFSSAYLPCILTELPFFVCSGTLLSSVTVDTTSRMSALPLTLMEATDPVLAQPLRVARRPHNGLFRRLVCAANSRGPFSCLQNNAWYTDYMHY